MFVLFHRAYRDVRVAMSQTATYEITPEQTLIAQISGAIIAVLGILAITFPFFSGLSLSFLLDSKKYFFDGNLSGTYYRVAE
jgi:hypothetical protein